MNGIKPMNDNILIEMEDEQKNATGTRMKLPHWAGIWLTFRMFPLPNFYKHSKSGGL